MMMICFCCWSNTILYIQKFSPIVSNYSAYQLLQITMQGSHNPFGLSTPQTNLFQRQSGLPNRIMEQIRNLGRKSNYTHETLSQFNGDESHRNPLGTFS